MTIRSPINKILVSSDRNQLTTRNWVREDLYPIQPLYRSETNVPRRTSIRDEFLIYELHVQVSKFISGTYHCS